MVVQVSMHLAMLSNSLVTTNVIPEKSASHCYATYHLAAQAT